MPGSVKIVVRPEASASYVRAISTGLGITLKHMVKPKKQTQQYPDEKWDLPATQDCVDDGSGCWMWDTEVACPGGETWPTWRVARCWA